MYEAALEKDNVCLKVLVNEPGMTDTPAEDGLTGFAISLVLKNAEAVENFLTSDLQPKNDMMFLAKEVLKLPPGKDSQLKHLQNSIKGTLKSLRVEYQSIGVTSETHVSFVPFAGFRREKFPFINPLMEKKECYHKNKTWQEQELHHSLMTNNWMVKSESLGHLILGKFCIEATSECPEFKWTLQNVINLPCRHEKAR